MEKETIRIRTARLSDAAQIRAIYAPYVEQTAITFEYEVPTVAEFERRMRGTLEKYPYLVAERGGELLGYAYAGAFVGRAAYDWSAETSIYLRRDVRKTGLGRALYGTMERVLKAQHILNLCACIGCPEQEDEHLTRNSVEFHAHLGYRLVGEFSRCGYKFGTWYNMVWMEKLLGDHPAAPAPIVPFPALDAQTLRACGVWVSGE